MFTSKLKFTVPIILSFVLFLLPITSSAEPFNMTYLHTGSASDFYSKVQSTQGTLDVVSVNYFNIAPDGSLTLNKPDRRFIDSVHSDRVKVVPFLSNHWDRERGRLALKNREALARQIAKAISDYDLDGVNVDLENLTPEDRDAHTDFIRLLRQAIPANKEVSVAVAANPKSWTTGWHGSYDLRGLSKHADYLMLMSYDEHYQNGPSGPVASLPFVEASIKQALKEVPRTKLVMGVPFFGRYWDLTTKKGGYGITTRKVEDLIRSRNLKPTFDPVSQTPSVTLTVPSGLSLLLGSKTVDEGSYIIYYENQASIKAKLELALKYNLRGVGSWSLGQEPSSFWELFRAYDTLSKKLYGGTKANLSTQPSTKTIGKTPSGLSKEEIAQAIAKHPSANAISRVTSRGIFYINPSNPFLPNAFLTRGEAAYVLVNAIGLSSTKTKITIPFRDVSPSSPYAKSIAIAYEHGVLGGATKTTFEPNAYLTREQLAVILFRLATKSKPYQQKGTLPKIVDVPSTSPSSKAIGAIVKSGLLTTDTKSRFRPSEPLTKAEMAVVVDRILNK